MGSWITTQNLRGFIHTAASTVRAKVKNNLFCFSLSRLGGREAERETEKKKSSAVAWEGGRQKEKKKFNAHRIFLPEDRNLFFYSS
jgi:hypothetical protein